MYLTLVIYIRKGLFYVKCKAYLLYSRALLVHMYGLGGHSKGRKDGLQSFSSSFLHFFLSRSLISCAATVDVWYSILPCMTHLAFTVVKAGVSRRSIKKTA